MTRAFSVAVVCALSLACASVAKASVTVGQLATPTTGVNCDGPFTMLQTTPSYTVPSSGVITSWSVANDASTIRGLELKVGRLVATDQYQIVGESSAGTQTPNDVSTFPTQIPVRAGDIIGETEAGGDCLQTSPSDSIVVTPTDAPAGTTATFTNANALLPVRAKVEPDADGDGFGDETQDQCPTDAATHGPCPAPPSAPPVTPPAHLSIDGTIAKVLNLSKRGSLSFILTGSQTTTGSATGTISIPKGAKVVRFKTAKFRLAPGKLTKVTLKLSKGALKSVRHALKHHKLKTKITIKVGSTAKTLRTTLKH